mgnify:CR=1 FL=1
MKPVIKDFEEDENGNIVGQITASEDEIQLLAENYLKKFGLSLKDTPHKIEKNPIPSKNATIKVNHKAIFLEGLKVAYEFTTTVLPEYFNDQWSKKISAFLFDGSYYDEIKNKIEVIKQVKAVGLSNLS